MRTLIHLLFLIPFFAVPAFGQTPAATHEVIKTISGREIEATALDRFLEQQLKASDIPGLSIAIINDARIVYHRALGTTNMQTGERINEHTLFEAASLSKPLFAWFVMQQVEKGILDLDKPLYEYLPYSDIAHDERYKRITARMVLSHTSGFPNWRDENPDGRLDIKFEPGTDYEYSGEGYQYLKMVLAHLLDTDDVGLDVIFQKEAVELIDAEHLYYTWNEYQAQHKATGHRDGMATDNRSQGDPEIFGAAYSLHTEAVNYSRFLIAMMQKKGLTHETWNEMLRMHFRHPEEGKKTGQSLGFAMKSTPYGLLYGHTGNNGDFKAYTHFYKDKNHGIVMFVNADNLFSSGFAERLAEFLDE